jgi:hypothetical protein
MTSNTFAGQLWIGIDQGDCDAGKYFILCGAIWLIIRPLKFNTDTEIIAVIKAVPVTAFNAIAWF